MRLIFEHWHMQFVGLLTAAQSMVSFYAISFHLQPGIQNNDEQSKVLSNADLQ